MTALEKLCKQFGVDSIEEAEDMKAQLEDAISLACYERDIQPEVESWRCPKASILA